MKLLTCAVCILAFSTVAFSQRLHLNLFAGTANYQGDLQEKRFTFKQAHGAFGIGGGYELNDKFMLRGMATIAKISAHDKYGKNADRNLSFESKLYEAQAGLEYYLKNPYEHSIVPYVFAGIAAYHFNPYTYDSSGAQVFLQPLSTEGQGFVDGRSPYKFNQFAIPLGAGLKFSMGDNFRIGIEAGFRKTFTDYLDDVSTTYIDENLLLAQKGPRSVELAFRGDELKNGSSYPHADALRGGAKQKDWYYFSGITASIRLGGSSGGSGSGKRGKGGVGCPAAVF